MSWDNLQDEILKNKKQYKVVRREERSLGRDAFDPFA